MIITTITVTIITMITTTTTIIRTITTITRGEFSPPLVRRGRGGDREVMR
jgi:hypothetical protein